MRTILLTLCIFSNGCLTAALHEVAFPEGNEYDYARDADGAERSSEGFRICFQGPDGKTQVALTRTANPDPLYSLPLSAVKAVEGGPVWTGTVSPGCTLSALPGQILPPGSLLFEGQAALLQNTRRASVSTTALPSSARILSAEISGDKKHLRLTTSTQAPVVLRQAGPGELEPEYASYVEDQWILEKKTVQTTWEPLETRDQKFLGIYYMHPSGSMRLKAFPLPDLQRTEIAYVPYLAERPESNRYYLIPLYPLAVVVDVLTVALQLTIWYDEGARTASCLRW